MRPLLIFLAVFVVTSCSKDKFTNSPQLKVISVNSNNISGSQTLIITLDLTDKQGDFSPFFAIMKTVNTCPNDNFTDSTLFQLPQAFIDTKKTEGTVTITLDQIHRGANTCLAPGGGVKTDTAIYRFWTRDQAGNTSDTASTGPIIIQN